MFWTTEIIVTVPGIFVKDYETAEPTLVWLQFGTNQDENMFEHMFEYQALIKIIRRSILSIVNILMFIYYVKTLEKEDRNFYEDYNNLNHNIVPRVLSNPSKTISKWLQPITYYGTRNMEQALQLKQYRET